jgi:hypothetical protein
MCNLQQRIHELDIENKVLRENGSYDDYGFLLTEANSQISEQKKGLLSRIFQWFSDIFAKIGETISSIFNSKPDLNAKYDAPAGLFDQGLNSLMDGISSIMENKIVGMFASIAIGKVVDQFNAMLGQKFTQLKDWFLNQVEKGGIISVPGATIKATIGRFQKFEGTLNKFIGNAQKANPNDDNEVDKESGMLKTVGSALSDVSSKAIGKLKSILFGNKSNDQNNQQNNNQQNNTQQNNNQQNNTQQNNNQQAANKPRPKPAPAPNVVKSTFNANQNNNTTNNNNTNNANNNTGTPTTASAETPDITDNELSLFESVFGKLDETKDDDISDILDMI